MTLRVRGRPSAPSSDVGCVTKPPVLIESKRVGDDVLCFISTNKQQSEIGGWWALK